MKRALLLLPVLCLMAAAAVEGAEGAQHDAIILRWNRTFQWREDGSVVRRVERAVKILTPRAVGEFADPRIDYEEGREVVKVLMARTIRPDGKTIVPVPAYSFNTASPRDVAGYPAWAAWRQKIVSFSAVEPGATLEFSYEIESEPGVFPWLEVNERLDAKHPVLLSTVTVRVPGAEPRTWKAVQLPPVVEEPQSVPIRERARYARFSTCPDYRDWMPSFSKAVNRAAEPDDAIASLARKAARGAEDAEDRVEKVVRKLRDTVRVVDSRKTWRSRACRPAAEVLRSGYASPLEAAALSMAALESLEVDSALVASVRGYEVLRDLIDANVFAFLLCATTSESMLIVHPRDGIVRSADESQDLWVWEKNELPTTFLAPRGADTGSEVDVKGRIAIDGKGQPTGKLEVRLTGLFLEPWKLRSADAQKKRLTAVLARLADGLEAKSHTVLEMSDDTLRATVEVGGKALPAVAGGRLLWLGDGPIFLADVPLPLGRSERRTRVRIRGAVLETIDVEFAGPGKPAVMPAGSEGEDGSWGRILQSVEPTEDGLRLRRKVEIGRDTLSTLAFYEIRRGLNALRAEGSRIVLFVK